MKKNLKIVLLLAALWLSVTLIWLGWARSTYSRYTDGMRENAFSTWITPRYYTTDDVYTYLVKFPDYLSFVGNLAVSAQDDAANVQAFLIWIPFRGEKEYGLLIADGEQGYQIYTDVNGRPLDEQYVPVADKYADEVEKIVSSAKNMWNIE